MESSDAAEESPDVQRPESLPQQVSRLATAFGRAAYRTRASWTPWAILAAFFLLPILNTISYKLVPYSSRPVWIRPILLALSSAFSGGGLFIGLWTALADRRVAVRWGIGFAAMLLLTVPRMASQIPAFSAVGNLAAFSGSLFVWAPWITTGLVVRAAFRRVLARDGEAGKATHFRIADLLLLTAVWAGFFAADRLAKEWMGVTQGDRPEWGIAAVLAIGMSLQIVLPLLPALWAVLGRERFGWLGTLVAAGVSWGLLTAATIGVTLVSMAQMSAGGVTFTPDYLGMAIGSFGRVLGVVGFALGIRWAGYRLRKVESVTVAEEAA